MRDRIIFATRPELADTLQRLDALIAQGRLRVVKNEARTLAGFLTLRAGEELFIKRFESRGWIDGLIERFRGSRARRSLVGAALLDEAGFNRPIPFAVLELRQMGSIRRSWLLGEALVDARTFSRFLDRSIGEHRMDPVWRRSALSAVAIEIRRLHDARILSTDLQETNLMLEEADDRFRVYFVDLDGFHRVRKISNQCRVRNLVQLDRSIGRFLSRTERLRFLYSYLGRAPGRVEVRRLLSELFAESGRKDREYARRRRRRALRLSKVAGCEFPPA